MTSRSSSRLSIASGAGRKDEERAPARTCSGRMARRHRLTRFPPILSNLMYKLFTHRDSYGMTAELVLEELEIEYEPIVFNVHVEAE